MLIHLIRIRVSLVYFPHRRAWSEWCDCRCHRTFSAQVPPTMIRFQSIRKGNFSVCFTCLQDFLQRRAIYSGKWLIAGELKFKWNRFEFQMNHHESLSCLFELHRRTCFLFRVNLRNQTNREDEHPSENDSPWALSHMNEPWNQDDEFKLQRIALARDFLSLKQSRSVSDLLIGLERMHRDLFSRR